MTNGVQNQAKGNLVFSVTVRESKLYELRTVPDSEGFQEIIGGCWLTDFGDWVEIGSLEINPKYRRLRIATYLIYSVIEDWADTRLVCLLVDTQYFPDAPMDTAQLTDWYKRLGFSDGTPFHKGDGWMSFQGDRASLKDRVMGSQKLYYEEDDNEVD